MTFDRQPSLKGKLVELRPLRVSDYESLYRVASDPLIWEQHPVQDRYREEVFRVFFEEAIESRGTLIVTDAVDGEVIGSSRYHGYDKEKDEVEIGWTFLARSRWGGVYNSEIKHLMLKHAFDFVSTVVFLVGPGNVRSRRAVEKIGAIGLGSRTDGAGRDSLAFAICAEHYRGEP